ncbi:30S ribosomal protein S1 [Thalassobacillus devorans]|uniref:30S ribosomal protein S1 n=1 Tax=Thalassobacillus devorans TaxID=279813 RepID=A0ABQ1NYK3_9BACI|nr:30S ribosomal protein S1 [Thalassobacillus devorans]NIK28323.1 small subunit ribosomal protein S1 [Thalassobacillus devorans]GGC87187.1 30S ribosomal protein S1 [Thalassobacillus devorans]
MDEMNQEVTGMQEFSTGDIVTGKVVKVEEKQVLVDVGYKVEGIVPISELSSLHVEKASDVVSEGDEIKLQVKKVEDDEIVLSKRAVDADKAWEELEAKYESGEVFEAEVKDIVKGGLVVDVGLRGFIPASLVETYYVENFDEYKGKPLTLKVVELDREQNRVILSHRAVVEEEESSKKQEVLNSLEEGQVVDGTVQRITDFGAFVNLGGIDGLVHISQLSHEHVEKASDVVEEGQQIKVKVLSVDRDNERISLSYKETQPGPWHDLEQRVERGAVLEGTVKRLVNFGAFVEVLPGVEGLVHISQIATRHIGTPDEELEVGQQVKVKVLDVDEHAKRLSLSIKELEREEDRQELKQYEKEDDHSGFQLGDMIGDKLDKYKN